MEVDAAGGAESVFEASDDSSTLGRFAEAKNKEHSVEEIRCIHFDNK